MIIRPSGFFKFIASLIVSVFFANTVMPSCACAQAAPAGVSAVAVPVVAVSEAFAPAVLRGFRVDPDNPLHFDFILDKGDFQVSGGTKDLSSLEKESTRLIKYFLTALTVPSEDLWVNLSPYEADRIIPDPLGQTEMGRTFLEQDYLLKQLTSALICPERKLGAAFWKRVYAKAYARFGTTQVPLDSLNKVWIMPGQAKVYEKGSNVYIVDAGLKVMLETDYKSVTKAGEDLVSSRPNAITNDASTELYNQIMREVIIPELTREVNEGRNFAALRQAHYALVLAAWVEKKIKDSVLDKAFTGQNRIKGYESNDPKAKDRIYAQYVEAFRKGAYNYIREEVEVESREVIPRKYFAGGYAVDKAQIVQDTVKVDQIGATKDMAAISVRFDPLMPSQGGQPFGYIAQARLRAEEGREIVLKAVMNDPSLKDEVSVVLHSNKDGIWQDSGVLTPAGEENGKAVFEIRLKAEKSFEYTFAFDQKSSGERVWADLPYGNGQLIVQRKFTGSVVYIGMEYAPFVKKGGQGDVMYELPRAMARKGNDTTVILPYFKGLEEDFLKRNTVEDVPGITITIPFRHHADVVLKVKKAVVEGVVVYLLDAQDEVLFVEPYQGPAEEFYESILLSRGALELLKALDKKVDIVQSNDHHTALVDLYMQKKYQDFFRNSGSYFAIHNVAYQGEYDGLESLESVQVELKPLMVKDLVDEIGLGDSPEIKAILTVEGKINMMASVPKTILNTGGRGQYVGTVSKGYAEHIREVNFGMDQLLTSVGDHFLGILNGIDFEIWNPATDKVIQYKYSIDQGIDSVVKAKRQNKQLLQQMLGQGLPVPEIDKNYKILKKAGYLKKSSRQLLGVVGRFVGQKQFEILADVIEMMLNDPSKQLPVDFVLAGPAVKDTDDLATMRRFKALAGDPRLEASGMSIVVLHGFVNEIGNMIYAGADGFIGPSDFEPAGIFQLISMRYGTVPVVRKTGGLADTVFEDGGVPNGFVFEGTYRSFGQPRDAEARRQNAAELYEALARANAVYAGEPSRWQRIMANGMQARNDWNSRIGEYDQLYTQQKAEVSADSAMNTAQGGIDFDRNKVHLDITSEGAGGSFNFTPAMLNNGNIEGLSPVIISISPLQDVPQFLASSR